VPLGCLLEVLGLRRIEPERPGRLTIGGLEPPEKPAACAGLDRSVILSSFVAGARAPAPAPTPTPTAVRSSVGDGDSVVNFSSLEADSILVWRSSKLTEGRKSYVVPVLLAELAVSPFRPKEKRVWLLADDALSMGALETSPVFAWLADGSGRFDPLFLVW
jgi:hypothetical protein